MTKEFDKVELKNQSVEVIKCKECDHLMVNIDADQLQPGDLSLLKNEGVRISNPETSNPVCVNCEVKSFAKKVADWFEKEDDDNDESFFSHTPSSSGSIFGGSGGFGGFGGFGGGGFGGAGASRGF